MGAADRIPFGRLKQSGEIVDVGGVRNGRACECVCPSCGCALLARQGSVRGWHFAHDVSAVGSSPSTQCALSWFVATRLAVHSVVRTIETIALPNVVAGHAPNTLPVSFIASTAFAGVPVDGAAHGGKWMLVLYITHPERPVPEALRETRERNVGVIELNLGHLQPALSAPHGRYIEELRRLLTSSTVGKRWIWHRDMPPPKPKAAIPVSEVSTNRAHRRRCVMCLHQWVAASPQEYACPACLRSALYTAEIPS